MIPGEDRHAAWETRDWQQQAARWPDPLPQHVLGPAGMADMRAWPDHMERAAAIIRGSTEISQGGHMIDETKPEDSLQVWRAVFDTAIGSMNFGSGFLDDEEVEALRAAAVLLGVDPDTATPRQFICRYRGHHAAHPFLDSYMFTGLDGVLRNAYRSRKAFPPEVQGSLTGSAASQAVGLGILRAPVLRMFCPDCGRSWDALDEIPLVNA